MLACCAAATAAMDTNTLSKMIFLFIVAPQVRPIRAILRAQGEGARLLERCLWNAGPGFRGRGDGLNASTGCEALVTRLFRRGGRAGCRLTGEARLLAKFLFALRVPPYPLAIDAHSK